MNERAMVRGRGRPREFDTDEVLDRVIDVFWTKGYEATSVADLAEVSGLNKSSIYNTFGSKEQLFRLAIDRYVDGREAIFHALLRDGSSGLGDVLHMLKLARREADAPLGWRGCMAVNTTTELGGREAAVTSMSTHFRDDIRISFRAALDRAAAAGEIDADAVERYAELLLAFMLSLSVFSRGGADRTELGRQFDAMSKTIETWRIAPKARPKREAVIPRGR
jgi:TetR/AcrR family transcriptional repressor of nem operon